MKCNNCGGNLNINKKGQLECPQCSGVNKKLTVQKFVYNNFEAYKVLKSLNVVVDEVLLPEEIEELINKGVEIRIC